MKLVRSAVLVTAAAAVSLMPTAALADTSGHRDATGDLMSVAYDPATGNVTDSPSTAEPTKTLGDISKVGVVHSDRTVKITLRFRDLSAAGFEQVHEFAIASPNRNRLVYVVAYPGHWGGKATMRTPHGKKVSCSLHHRIDYGHNTVTVKVPRSCLGRPKVVKVGAATLVGYGSKIYYDDAYATGGEFTDPFTLSPRIHR